MAQSLLSGERTLSTLAYASLTTRRDVAKPNTSASTSPPGVNSYVDALAALVPAEVLTLHGLVLSVTTTVKDKTTTISDSVTLGWAFAGLLVLSMTLYAAPRVMDKKWDKLDFIRVCIPPLALLGWTMLQRSTAFDAVFPSFQDAPRTVSALFLGVVLGLIAAALANKADQKH